MLSNTICWSGIPICPFLDHLWMVFPQIVFPKLTVGIYNAMLILKHQFSARAIAIAVCPCNFKINLQTSPGCGWAAAAAGTRLGITRIWNYIFSLDKGKESLSVQNCTKTHQGKMSYKENLSPALHDKLSYFVLRRYTSNLFSCSIETFLCNS